jgi:hypothetical protein
MGGQGGREEREGTWPGLGRGSARDARPPATGRACGARDTSPNEPGFGTPVAPRGMGLLVGVVGIAWAAPAATMMTMVAATAPPPRRLGARAMSWWGVCGREADCLASSAAMNDSAAGGLDPQMGPENGVDVLARDQQLHRWSAASRRAAPE